MKKIIVILLLTGSSLMVVSPAKAQAEELAQLVLNIEKLMQFKQILSDLKKGYDILFGGYTTIKNIAEGNFNLHKAFLDGLLAVSPAVRNYSRIADIINCQRRLMKEYKTAVTRFSESGEFTISEIEYMGSVFTRLTDESLKNLDALAMVITADKLRMSDDERIAAIDSIYTAMEDKLSFLRWFNNNNTILAVQRLKERNDARVMLELYK